MSAAVGVMARAPSSGGKSRLAPHLTPARLASLRAALLADTLDALAPLSAVTIFFTPDAAVEEMRAIAGPGRPCVPQGDGDLGVRMLRALQFLLSASPAAILVGADIPLHTANDVAEAAETLQHSGGVVLGPADDGGYCLIGMTRAHAELFDGVEWGKESVLTDTLRAADRAGIEARLVRSAYDVDTIDDLRRLERDLAAAPGSVCANVRAWLTASRR